MSSTPSSWFPLTDKSEATNLAHVPGRRLKPSLSVGGRRPRWRRLPPLGLLALAACIVGPDREAGLEVKRFAPPPIYEIWWAEMEECTGIEGDLGRVRFYRVLAPLNEKENAFPCDERGTMCPAFWREPHDIFLAPAVIESEWIVKHEMWHDLRQITVHRKSDRCPGTFSG